MLLRGQMTEFHMNAILPIASYTNGVSFPIQFTYRPKATPFTGEACETIRSLARIESCWKTRGTVLLHCLPPSRKFQHGASGCCVGFCRAKALIGNARQATSEGKSGLVETGLTGPETTALYPGPNTFMVLQARPTFTREGRVWWTAYWYMLNVFINLDAK